MSCDPEGSLSKHQRGCTQAATSALVRQVLVRDGINKIDDRILHHEIVALLVAISLAC